MKKVFYTLALGVIFSSAFSSCKKCGHCRDAFGNNSSATCQNSTLAAVGVDEYKQAEADCKAQTGSTWVVQ